MKNGKFEKRSTLLGKLRGECGNVAIFTALAAPVMILLIGGGMDHARMLAARAKLQAAADDAVLATYKHYSQNPNASTIQLKDYFGQHLRSSLQSQFEKPLVILEEKIVLDKQTGSMKSFVKAKYPSSFLSIGGYPKMEMSVDSEVRASLSYTEVALVLDTTGSMAGSKLEELKNAAKQFLDTIHARLQGDPEAFKVAIVPFGEYVNVGMDKRNAWWINVPEDRVVTGDVQVCRKWVCDVWGYGEKGLICLSGHHEPLDPCQTQRVTLDVKWQGCVGSRQDPLNIEDGTYTNRVPGVMNYKRNPQYPETDVNGWHDWGLNNCGAPLTPLTTLKDNKNDLVASIEALTAKGFTYIPSGLVWGWRVLSNKEPFSEGASDTDVRNKNVNKIIILMTDGANTRAPATVSWMRWADHGSEDVNLADNITRRLCDNIKAINPATGRRNAEIITVTFDISDPDIKKLMQECASLGSFDAASGQLTEIFDQIAQSLVELHLSK